MGLVLYCKDSIIVCQVFSPHFSVYIKVSLFGGKNINCLGGYGHKSVHPPAELSVGQVQGAPLISKKNLTNKAVIFIAGIFMS